MTTKVSINDQRIFISDCEGPISKNDNAFELTSSYIPNGSSLFAVISKYDDILADIVKKPDYKAGDTLRLILPFLKAHGLTDSKINDFSIKNILLVPGAKKTLTFVRTIMPSFIVSTSYEHYISSLCKLTNFPFRNTYCTLLNLDDFDINKEETKTLVELGEVIASMPLIQIPKNASSVEDLSEEDQLTIKRLDRIFWKEIPKMDSGKMLSEINPIGGSEKVNAVKEIVEKLDSSLENVMYVGDSITDAKSLRLVRENQGLAVSFNGNDYSIRESDIALLSENTIVTSIIAESFNRFGKDKVFKLLEEWSPSGLKKYGVSEEFSKLMLDFYSNNFPQVEKINDENLDRLQSESSIFRKTVRGEAIGKLG